MNRLAIVTIVSNNYLHFARTLMQSVARHHPEARRYCAIVDRDISHAAKLSGEFQAIELDELKLPGGDDFLYQYNILELNTAVKPWVLQQLIERGYKKIVYIDPDIVLYRPLTEALAPLDHDADIVLTPHLLAPVADTLRPSEIDIRRTGAYNLGFCALGTGPNALSLLQWWQGKLHRGCIIAPDQGIFVDQSWMDLVPGLFPRVSVLRHPGYNVAYWNLIQRPLTRSDGQVLVAGKPLVFFHYSGLDPIAPQNVSKHQNRLTLNNISDLASSLIDDYCRRVKANGIERYRGIPYGFADYEDGAPINDSERVRYRTNDTLRALVNGKPFQNRKLITAEILSYLENVYAYLLGRAPDQAMYDHYIRRSNGLWSRFRITFAVALSTEFRARPGWFQCLLCWPMRQAHITNRVLDVDATFKPSGTIQSSPSRPKPYEGLNTPDPDSAENGIWMGPRLYLPTCTCTEGRLRIRGFVDSRLLRRGGARSGQQFQIHGPKGLLGSQKINKGGVFVIELTINPADFADGNQWVILASAHVVPKNIGLGEDTRQLAWRVQQISVDEHILVDSARSPITLPIQNLSPPNGFNLIGYLSAELGLGEAARSLASACVAKEIPFSAIDVGFQSSNPQRDTRIMAQAVNTHFPIDLIYVNADQIAETIAYLESKRHPRGYRIGFWHWEQPRIPDASLGAFAHVDEVWAPSTFVCDAVAPLSPVPVVKIPHALEVSVSPDLNRGRLFGLPENKQLALLMYDFHSYQERKNPQAALAAFRLAASHRNDAALVIKTINSQYHPEMRSKLEKSVADLPDVIFIDDFLTRKQTWDLEACCDFLISLHRAEGFGLVPAEMMYLGKPVVATGWSANMDFMTAENSFPVRYRLKRLIKAVGVYPAGQYWAEADVDHAAECIGQLLDSPDLRQHMGQQAADDIRRQLSPQAVGALVQERLSLLGFWHPGLRP